MDIIEEEEEEEEASRQPAGKQLAGNLGSLPEILTTPGSRQPEIYQLPGRLPAHLPTSFFFFFFFFL